MIKRKDGRWQEQIKLPGMDKPKYFYGKTQKEVRRKMAEWSQDKESQQEKAAMFEIVADEWINWKADVEKVGLSTYHGYIPVLREIKEWFSGRDINSIYTDEVLDFLNAAADKGLGKSAIEKRKAALCGIWDYAILKRISRSNPARAAKMPKNLPAGSREAPEETEMEKVRAAFDSDLGLFPLIQCYTGLRRGEVLALTWDDVDLDKGVIHIDKAIEFVNSVPRLKKPKTKAGERDVVILDVLKEQLPKGRSGIIFPGKDGGYMRLHEYNNMWVRWCYNAGLTTPKESAKPGEFGIFRNHVVTITSHQLRHYYATFLYEAGVGLRDMQELLGHSNPQTTMRVYTHIRKKHKEETVEKLNSFLCQNTVKNGESVDK